MSLDTESQTTIPTQFRNSKKKRWFGFSKLFAPRNTRLYAPLLYWDGQWWNERDVRTLHNLTLLLFLCALLSGHTSQALASHRQPHGRRNIEICILTPSSGGQFHLFSGFWFVASTSNTHGIMRKQYVCGRWKALLRGFAFCCSVSEQHFSSSDFRFEPYTGVWTAICFNFFFFCLYCFTNYVSFRQARNLY